MSDCRTKRVVSVSGLWKISEDIPVKELAIMLKPLAVGPVAQ
jgi:hypothetical protein